MREAIMFVCLANIWLGLVHLDDGKIVYGVAQVVLGLVGLVAILEAP